MIKEEKNIKMKDNEKRFCEVVFLFAQMQEGIETDYEDVAWQIASFYGVKNEIVDKILKAIDSDFVYSINTLKRIELLINAYPTKGLFGETTFQKNYWLVKGK